MEHTLLACSVCRLLVACFACLLACLYVCQPPTTHAIVCSCDVTWLTDNPNIAATASLSRINLQLRRELGVLYYKSVQYSTIPVQRANDTIHSTTYVCVCTDNFIRTVPGTHKVSLVVLNGTIFTYVRRDS